MMEEALNQGGELIISVVAALFIIGTFMLLLGRTDAGVLRMFLTDVLEAAC